VVAQSEVAIRWDHPAIGVLDGRKALAQADADGYGRVLSQWLVERACRQALVWRANTARRPSGVSAPLTDEQLASADVAATVAAVLARTGAPADLLTVQVAASALDVPSTRDAVVGLAALGVRVAAETDGTAARSLALAQALPVSELLLDVGALSRSSADLEFARALCVVAARTGLTPVAVGVDDSASAALLAELGVTVAQGDAIAPLVPGDRLGEWLGAGVR
jgi:EAL domain-containing protein (putative c-di-GMP-specific phosphodiesterase class I)